MTLAEQQAVQPSAHTHRPWAEQPAAFFEQAIIDMDGFLVETTGQCKQGMDIAYDGTWGYHALVLTLANTGEVLSIVNRPGNRPSHEGAAALVDQATAVCFRGGFRRALLRGDTARDAADTVAAAADTMASQTRDAAEQARAQTRDLRRKDSDTRT